MMMSSLPQITVHELAEKMATAEALQLVDVREAQEIEIASLPGFLHFPLSEAQSWSGNIHSHLDPELETLVLCHHGMRSAQMCQWLMNQGFSNVKNISGGIDAYAIQVDRTVPRY